MNTLTNTNTAMSTTGEQTPVSIEISSWISTTNHGALDILSELEMRAEIGADSISHDLIVAAPSVGEEVATATIDHKTLIADPLEAMIEQAKRARTHRSLGSQMVEHGKFLLHYVAVSTAVFAVLLISTNWAAYWAVLENVLNPDQAKASGAEILSTLDRSKMNVFASESKEKIELNKQTADEIKAQLDADGVHIDEDAYSMKRLLPAKPNVTLSFDVAPYENRIIIPKIGKNVPLVDVLSTNTFDFNHMENIFMQELEKGVVRYPGSALPGELGNAFIFGHSSNYPWIKGEYNSVFALLDDLQFGDEIIVYYKQKKYVYVIREKKIVKPGDVKALERDPSKRELSLMTCWPIGTTLKRMLVFAELQQIN